jgi:5-hydroxyisourate hydrolase
MSQITTHVLDTSIGRPGQGISLVLEGQHGEGWREIARGVTNNDGRVADLLAAGKTLEKGIYRITFDTAAYFKKNGKKGFYPYVSIVFEIEDGSHYHVPLLLNPYGYSTYRGS